MQAILDFIMAHKGAESAVGIFLIDYIFSLKSNWESNGLGHWIHLTIKKLLGGNVPTPPAA